MTPFAARPKWGRLTALAIGGVVYSVGLVVFRDALSVGFADFPWVPWLTMAAGCALIAGSIFWGSRP